MTHEQTAGLPPPLRAVSVVEADDVMARATVEAWREICSEMAEGLAEIWLAFTRDALAHRVAQVRRGAFTVIRGAREGAA